MISLFIDTSSKDVSIALIRDGEILSKITECIPNEHSIYTVSYIDKCLKECKLAPEEVDMIMVVNGPGSFKGVRIGVTIAKTYGYLLQKKVIPVSSLKMLAIGMNSDYILALIDAKHDNYYMGLFDRDYNEVIPSQFANRDMVLEVIEKYDPVMVSNDDIDVNGVAIKKRELDIGAIVSYYENDEGVNVHMLNPNYLKLPQPMEEENDKRG